METNARKAMVAIRVFLAFLAIVILVVLVWLWIGAVDERNRRVVALSGGCTLEYLGTAYGNTNFSSETKWQHMARAALPKALSGWIPEPMRGSIYNGSNALAVYVLIKGPPGAASAAMPWTAFRAVDDAGDSYQSSGATMSSYDAGTGIGFFGMSMRAYPRRQPEFWFEMGGSPGAALARFRVKNPVSGPFPVWNTLPVPQTATNGPVELTLKSLALSNSPSGKQIIPQFSFTTADPAWAQAKASRESFVDATGNESYNWLSPLEPAWKIRARVTRRFPDDFAAEEVLVLTNISIPNSGTFAPMDVKTNESGVELDVIGLAGAGKFGISNGVVSLVENSLSTALGTVRFSSSSNQKGVFTQTWSGASPSLIFETGRLRDGFFQEFVTDQDGQKVEANFEWVGGAVYRLSLHPLSTSRTLTMRLAINHPLPFEFVVNPAEALSNAPGVHQAASPRR